MYFLYSLLYCIALLFLLPVHYLKRPEELRKKWLREKFGFIDPSFKLPKFPHLPCDPSVSPLTKGGIKRGIIWIHAVSVGEVMAALPLLKKLRERYPSKGIILSTITDTGQKVGRNAVSEGISVVYLPFDIPFVLKTVLKRVTPEILLTIETELWPNIFKVFRDHGIPIVLMNGRISGNSFKGYKKISFFMKRVLSNVSLFCMQSDLDAERIGGLGVNRDRIKVLGNFKFDTRPPSAIPAWAKRIVGPVVIAGSTHEGEEELMISVYREMNREFPDLNLIVAPRHPERFKEVEDLLKSKGMSFVKRSTLGIQYSAPHPLPSPLKGEGRDGVGTPTPESLLSGTIILLDTVGELSAIYGISDIAIIGKSFKGYGGQNPLEPAYWGKGIVCGPHMENFPFIQDFYGQGAAIEVNEKSLYPALRELLLSPEKAKKVGEKAKELYMKNTGAVDRATEVISQYIN
jgi:3-deoxy-D-manno-octulosonic-acid transferase